MSIILKVMVMDKEMGYRVGQQPHNIINVCVFVNKIQKMDMEDPPKCHIPLKGQQAYTIINICAFVNIIQKEIEMDME